MYFVSQKTHNGCALACLDMLLLGNGINLSKKDLYFFTGDDPILSLLDISNILKYFGIKSKSFLSKNKQLSELNEYKVMLLHNKHHFYIVERQNNQKYLVYDPAGFKPIIKNEDYIHKHWDGYFLVSDLNKYYLPLFARNPFIAFKTKLVLFSIVFFSLLFLYLAI